MFGSRKNTPTDPLQSLRVITGESDARNTLGRLIADVALMAEQRRFKSRAIPAWNTARTKQAMDTFSRYRFDRAIKTFAENDPAARVELDPITHYANGADCSVAIPMPAAANNLPVTDRASAAAVLFLDRFGMVFGIPGWHMLHPIACSNLMGHLTPVRTLIWFTFKANTANGPITVKIACVDDTVRHVRID